MRWADNVKTVDTHNLLRPHFEKHNGAAHRKSSRPFTYFAQDLHMFLSPDWKMTSEMYVAPTADFADFSDFTVFLLFFLMIL